MPRYYFHFRNDDDALDEEGLDLDGVEDARREAVRSARELIGADVTAGLLDLRHRIEVRDAGGGHVLTLTFGEAFEMRR